MSATVRTAKKLLLGREIAHMLEVAGYSQANAAKVLETTQPRIASLINGGGSIAPGDLMLLANTLGFTDEGYLEALRELRRDNHKRGFWSSGHNRAYAEEMRLRIDLEKHAEQLRTAEVEVIPGLLQCESYVRAMHEDQPDDGDVSVEDFVQARLARQRIFDKSEPPTAHFVLSESCLRRRWADDATMREQLHHLVSVSKRRNIMVQVLPFDAPPGRRSPVGNRFVLLSVPSPGAAGPLEITYVEGEGEIRYMDDKKALKAHNVSWARLTAAAMNLNDSRAFIKHVAEEFQD